MIDSSNEEFEGLQETLIEMFEEANEKFHSYEIFKSILESNGFVHLGEVQTDKNKYWLTLDVDALIIYDYATYSSLEGVWESYLQILKQVQEEEEIKYGEAEKDEEFIKALGRITLAFAHLEFSLSLFCGSHMGVKYPMNEIITSQLSFRQLINLASSIYHHSESALEKLEKLDNLLSKATQLEQERNTLVHSFYGVKGKTDATIIIRQKNTVRLKRGFNTQYEEMQSEKVNTIANEIKELSRQINLLIYDRSL